MAIHPVVIFVGGLVIITLGAEFVLRSASRIAALMGVKPILIGLTVVSVGTSMPELAVGITAVAEGKGPLAVGNIAGTNILNILFILGLSAALRPLPLQLQNIKLDVPVMIATSIVLLLMALDGILSKMEGLILIIAALIYTIALVRISLQETQKVKKEFEEEFSPKVLIKERGRFVWAAYTFLLLSGMALTVLGAELLVAGAVSIAVAFGVSDAIIGLTIVAIGTSAPELATTIVATIKNDRDVAVGNLIGSSISNVLVILGITCVVSANGVEVSSDILWLDLPLAALVAIVCYPVFRSERMISRNEGAVFVFLYCVYLFTLIYFRT